MLYIQGGFHESEKKILCYVHNYFSDREHFMRPNFKWNTVIAS